MLLKHAESMAAIMPDQALLVRGLSEASVYIFFSFAPIPWLQYCRDIVIAVLFKLQFAFVDLTSRLWGIIKMVGDRYLVGSFLIQLIKVSCPYYFK